MAKKGTNGGNGNGTGATDLMVELVDEVRGMSRNMAAMGRGLVAMRRDMNAGFRALIKREDRRWEDHESRLKMVEERLGIQR